MRKVHRVGVLAALAVFLCDGPVRPAITGLQRVASGLSSPIFVTYAPGDTSRLFIAQRGGAIRILDLNTGVLQTTPFLSMTGIDQTGEGGFLGLAFHPDYFTPGKDGYRKFYVNVTTTGAPLTTRIREFKVSETNPNLADLTSLREILSFAQPQANHNGGWIGFSPNDHYLYIASGDGGGSNDNGTGHSSGGNAQDITSNLLGKMLRIDVNRDGFPTDAARNYTNPASNPFVGVTGDDEIWAYGLRNPFRDSFDRITGDLWMGDVGQNNREEIDFQSGTSAGGQNYGWRLREGDIDTPTAGIGGAPPPNHSPPVYTYTHPDSTRPPLSPAGYDGFVVTGGYVYRGPDPSLQGKYFFLDSRNTPGAGDDNYWMANSAPFGGVTNIDSLLTPNTGSPQFPVSFGEDALGNLYIAYLVSGDVYRIQTNQLLTGDYDASGGVYESDYDNWQSGYGTRNGPIDGNKDGAVDAADYVMWRKHAGTSMRRVGDYDVDGDLDAVDYAKWKGTFAASTGTRVTDGNADGVVDAADYVVWRKLAGATVHDATSSGDESVPEPAASLMLIASIGFLQFRYRTSRRTPLKKF